MTLDPLDEFPWPLPDPRVLEVMGPYFDTHFGNPASHHRIGEVAAAAVAEAREAVAALIGARPRDIVFTSGALESDHLAVHGVLEAVPPSHGARWFTALPSMGAFRRSVQVSQVTEALTDLPSAMRSTTAGTTLLSLPAHTMDGQLLDLAAIGEQAREGGALFHCALRLVPGRLSVSVQDIAVDLLSIDGRALGAPAGVGALWVRHPNPRMRLQGQLLGGGQEAGLRAGTLNVPGIVGFGAAARLARPGSPEIRRTTSQIHAALADLDGVHLLGPGPGERLPGHLHFLIDGAGEAHRQQLLQRIDGLDHRLVAPKVRMDGDRLSLLLHFAPQVTEGEAAKMAAQLRQALASQEKRKGEPT